MMSCCPSSPFRRRDESDMQLGYKIFYWIVHELQCLKFFVSHGDIKLVAVRTANMDNKLLSVIAIDLQM